MTWRGGRFSFEKKPLNPSSDKHPSGRLPVRSSELPQKQQGQGKRLQEEEEEAKLDFLPGGSTGHFAPLSVAREDICYPRCPFDILLRLKQAHPAENSEKKKLL